MRQFLNRAENLLRYQEGGKVFCCSYMTYIISATTSTEVKDASPFLSPEDWRLALKTDKRGELLEVAKQGKAAFDEFLEKLIYGSNQLP